MQMDRKMQKNDDKNIEKAPLLTIIRVKTHKIPL